MPGAIAAPTSTVARTPQRQMPVRAEEDEVTPAPPRREQPEDRDEAEQAQAAIHGPDDELAVQAHDERREGQDAEEHEEGAGAHDEPGVGVKREHQRHDERALGDHLGERARQRDDRARADGVRTLNEERAPGEQEVAGPRSSLDSAPGRAPMPRNPPAVP